MKLLDRPTLSNELRGEPVEQFRMRGRLTVDAEIAWSANQSFAEVKLPDPVDDHARRQRTVHDPFGKRKPAQRTVASCFGERVRRSAQDSWQTRTYHGPRSGRFATNE